VLKLRRLADWLAVAVLTLCMAVAVSAQSKGIEPALLAKAKAGDVESQWLVGSAYEDTRHYTDAAVWLRKAAASGSVLAQDHLAYLYDQGDGVPQDDAQAAFWLRKAGEKGDSYAQFQLGVLYSGGNGVPHDDERAAFWWRKAAAQGNVDAQNALAQLETKDLAGLEKLLGRKVTRADQPNAPAAAPPVVPPLGLQLMDKQSTQDVIASLLPEAKAGDSEAERRVGIAYEDESAYTQTAFWIRKAAESGDAEAQYRLGQLYSEGHGVPQDKNLAAVWWRKAADKGNANAQSSLGLAYINGDGVPNDFAEAAFWLRRSAEQGDAHGQALLSMLYEAGWGVPKDYAQAAAWTRKAAEQGDSAAQGHLGDMYFNGQGVPQDFELAKFWYGKAASQGDADAQNALEQLESKLAATKAERKKRRDLIAVFALCLVLLGAVTLTAIRLRKKLIGYGKRLYPHNSRSRQLAVLLLVGCWCSACCLIQVLSRQAMHHPVNAAVTALLWAIPGLILGALCMWWLSHPLAENGPVPTPARHEPANVPTESTPESTELIAREQTSGYGFCCNNCGKPQPVSARFCSACGSSIHRLALDVQSPTIDARDALRLETERRKIPTGSVGWTSQPMPTKANKSGGAFLRFVRNFAVFFVFDALYIVAAGVLVSKAGGVDSENFAKGLTTALLNLSVLAAFLTSKIFVPKKISTVLFVGLALPAFVLFVLVLFHH
jgi:TPR repeat protein